jgi:hypothetical protein
MWFKFQKFGWFDKCSSISYKSSLIQLNINDWKNSTCTCKYFSKKYFCSHIIVVTVGLVTIPENCKNVNIGNLKKRGEVRIRIFWININFIT